MSNEDILKQWREHKKAALKKKDWNWWKTDRQNLARAYWFMRHYWGAAYTLYELGRDDEQYYHECYDYRYDDY